MFRRAHHQVVPLGAAPIEADSGLARLDQLVFGFLQLEGVHEIPLVDGPGVEQELVGGDGEERFGHLGHPRQQEI